MRNRTGKRALGLALCMAPLWMGADGCDDGPVVEWPESEHESCWVDGVMYAPGEAYPAGDGCNTCYCGGECTLIGCGELTACRADGLEPGESYAHDCNTCTCNADGTVTCTERDCTVARCEHGGASYEPGETFPLGDGCNSCSCGADGLVSCTATVCEPGCTFGEETFPENTSIVCPDGCNVCGCHDAGDGNLGWSSTDAACPALPQVERCEGENPENVTVHALYLDGDALALNVSPADGCDPRTFKLCWDGVVLESDPPQVRLWVEHLWAGGVCDASYTEDVVFDLTPLRQSESGTLIVNIAGEQLRYDD